MAIISNPLFATYSVYARKCYNIANSGECYIDVRSFGCNDGAFKGGHIRVNWTMVQSFTTTGIYLVLVDPVSCSGRPFPVVNTAGGGTAAAGVLINYLNIVTVGQVRLPHLHYYAPVTNGRGH